MADPDYMGLINAELDGELDAAQRAVLARCLLADPQAQALRGQMQRLGGLLDGMREVEPPETLRAAVFAALPQSHVKRPGLWSPAWRLAAVLAGVAVAGALVFETVKGPGATSGALSGTIVAQTITMVDSVSLGGGAVSGRVSLYRDRTQLALRFQMLTRAPVDVLVASGEDTLRINGLGGPDQSGSSADRTVPLPGFQMNGQPVDLTFLMDGRPVGRATLKMPAGQ